MTVKVLFVCLGNICRSPLAQGIFDDLCRQKNITHLVESDSAGTIGMHTGSSPDHRALNIARKKGIVLPYKARKISAQDFSRFDYILVMDDSNLNDVRKLQKEAQNGKAKIFKAGDFDKSNPGENVKDPYFGGDEGFEIVFHQLSDYMGNFIDKITKNL
jgi:protein-tyrosine phosphatase